MDVNQRIRELKEQGFSNAEVAEILTADGCRTKRGAPITAGMVSDRLYRMKQKDRHSVRASDTAETSDHVPVLTVVRRGPEEPLEPKTVQLMVVPKTSDKPDISDTGLISGDLMALIEQMIEDKVNAMMEYQRYRIDQTAEPPLPKRTATSNKGKPKAPGDRVKIAGTVDSVLGTKFDKWRTEKGITLSRALDIALWHFLGKPKMSFETSEESEL
jgi:hypothetical protein